MKNIDRVINLSIYIKFNQFYVKLKPCHYNFIEITSILI